MSSGPARPSAKTSPMRDTQGRTHKGSFSVPPYLRVAVTMLAVAWCLLAAGRLAAQDNYEIQVYGAELVPVRATMLELHSNYTTSGVLLIRDCSRRSMRCTKRSS